MEEQEGWGAVAKQPTHYDRLGVARNAPEEVIRGAYKALAQKNHPDKNINNPGATAVMQAINLAYDVLSDPGKRADYDARLDQEEMRERARTQGTRMQGAGQRTAAPSSPTYPGHSPAPAPRSGIGSLLLVVLLIAALFVAFFISGSVSIHPVLPQRTSTSLLPAQRSTKGAETVAPREITPQELATCVFAVAKTYEVPAPLLLSLLSAEGGAVGKKTISNGYTYDLGLMQINSFWIPELAQNWRVTSDTALRRLRDDACTNIGVGAWILQGILIKGGDLRSGIAFYRAAAHHLDAKADSEDYVDRVVKLMELYKDVRRPEDLIGQATAK